jgi:lysophospholipase L1-like esterase
MEIQLFRHHPIIGYTFIPNLKTRVEHEAGGYLIRTNSSGFRSEHEFTAERTEGKRRILLFGDSFTAGDGVSNKYRYSDLLESLLPGVEVYNFGLPGSGTDQHYLVWREIAHASEHDLIIIAAQVENIRRVAARYRLARSSSGEDILLAKPYFQIVDDELQLKGVPVASAPLKVDQISDDEAQLVDAGGRHAWLRGLVNKIGARDVVQRLTGYQPLPEYDDVNGHEWKLMKAILNEWTAQINAPVIVVPIPLYQYVEQTASPTAYQARFEELAAAHNVTVHDPLPDYFAMPRETRRSLRFQNDIHPTPEHHALLAKSIARAAAAMLGHDAMHFAAI